MPRVRTVAPDGERIRELRLDLGLSPKELGDLVGRHRSTITKLERGDIEKASDLLIGQIARALKTTRAEITARQPDGCAA